MTARGRDAGGRRTRASNVAAVNHVAGGGGLHLRNSVNVLFVNYHDFTSNSAVHIFNLANELELLGIRCAVCVPDNKRSSKRLGRPRFAVLDFSDARAGRVRFADGGAPTLVHAWTPRENVRLGSAH